MLPSHASCSGCSLCLLACPVWRQTRDIRLTPHGRAKALQHGAGAAALGASYYRFGGMMKGYIRRVFGDALVDRHLAMKRTADPGMILNRDVIF